jgi:hypothetical protein
MGAAAYPLLELRACCFVVRLSEVRKSKLQSTAGVLHQTAGSKLEEHYKFANLFWFPNFSITNLQSFCKSINLSPENCANIIIPKLLNKRSSSNVWGTRYDQGGCQ